MDDSILNELTEYYRNWLPCMTRRNIVTTEDEEPTEDFVEKIHATEPVSFENFEKEIKKLKTVEWKKSSREKAQRKKTKSESERFVSDSIVGEESKLSTCKHVETFVESVKEKKTNDEETWIKVGVVNLQRQCVETVDKKGKTSFCRSRVTVRNRTR